MKNRLFALALAAVLGAAGTTLLAQQNFNIRTGTWEFTFTMNMTGPIPGMSPEAAKQMQAMMAKPQTVRSCVNAADLKSLNLGKIDDDDDAQCKTTSIKVTATNGDVVRQCTGDEARTETAHFEASSPTAMIAKIDSKSANGGASNINLAGKWISADCKE